MYSEVKNKLGFNSAFVVYTTKYKGPIYVGIITILIVMFILPDIIAHQQTTAADGTIKYNAAINKVLSWLRASSVGLGVVAQGLGFIIIRKGDQYLKDAEQTLLKKNNLKPVKKDNDGKNPTT
jgi:hypothetical protein